MNRDELKLAVAEAAKTIAVTPGKSAYAELITELVQPNHLTYDILRDVFPVERRNPGDYMTRRIRKGKFRARTMVPGTQHLTDAVIYNNQFAYLFDRLICGTSANLMEVRRGELGTLDDIQRELKADLVDEVVSKMFNLLTTVWSATNTPSNYTNATSTGLTATVLDAAMENVIEKSGDIKAILGTRRALLNLFGFAGYKEFVLSDGTTRVALRMEEVLLERYKTGKISSYNGTPVVILPQIQENRLPLIDRKLIRDDVVLVIGNDPGNLVLFGDVEDQEHTDTSKQPADYAYWAWQAYGLLVDRPEQIHVIETA